MKDCHLKVISLIICFLFSFLGSEKPSYALGKGKSQDQADQPVAPPPHTSHTPSISLSPAIMNNCLEHSPRIIDANAKDLVASSRQIHAKIEGQPLLTPSDYLLLLDSLKHLKDSLKADPKKVRLVEELIFQLNAELNWRPGLPRVHADKAIAKVIQILSDGVSFMQHKPLSRFQKLLRKIRPKTAFHNKTREAVMDTLNLLLLFHQQHQNDRPDPSRAGGFLVSEPAFKIKLDYLKGEIFNETTTHTKQKQLVLDGVVRNADSVVIVGLDDQPKTIEMLKEEFILNEATNEARQKLLREKLKLSSSPETQKFFANTLARVQAKLEKNYRGQPGFENVNFKELATRLMIGVNQEFWVEPLRVETMVLRNYSDHPYLREGSIAGINAVFTYNQIDLNQLNFSSTYTIKYQAPDLPDRDFIVPIVLRNHFNCRQNPQQCGNEVQMDFLPLTSEKRAFHHLYDVKTFLRKSPAGKIAQQVFAHQSKLKRFLFRSRSDKQGIEQITDSFLNRYLCGSLIAESASDFALPLEEAILLSLPSPNPSKALQQTLIHAAVSKYISKLAIGFLLHLLDERPLHSGSMGPWIDRMKARQTLFEREILSDLKKDFPSLDPVFLKKAISAGFTTSLQEISGYRTVDVFRKEWKQKCEQWKIEQRKLKP